MMVFCIIPIYTNHFNLGFNKGTVISDPKNLLQGTRKWIRHIPVKAISDYRNDDAEELIKSAIDLALEHSTAKKQKQGLMISKIKD